MKTIQSSVASLTLAAGAAGSFIVCDQFFTAFTITVNTNQGLVSATLANPSRPVNDVLYTQKVNVTASAGAFGVAFITIKDKKGATVIVKVTVPETFRYTGSAQTLTVPNGVSTITVDAVGASGGNVGTVGGCSGATCASGGLGEEVVATLQVSAGEILYVLVGGVGGPADYTSPLNGAAGFNGGGGALGNAGGGGGGGGASDIRTAAADLTTRVIVAGGGGGGIDSYLSGGTTPVPQNGGNAGFTQGAAGGYPLTYSSMAGGGGVSPGGAAGNGDSVPPLAGGFGVESGQMGSLGVGGGIPNKANAGAGGGGYYGGGSGAWAVDEQGTGNLYSGAGGGGNSLVTNPAIYVSNGQATLNECDANNDGCITITF